MRLAVSLLLLASVGLAEDLAEVAAQLAAALDTGSAADAQAALSKLPSLYANAPEEQQKAALEAVGRAAKAEDLTVRHGAFAALGAIRSKGSSKYLAKWLGPPKKFKGEIPLSYVEAIRAAGQIADATTLATLEDLADHNDLPIAEAATQALGGFKDLPTKRRKALALDLVNRLEQLSATPRRKWSEEAAARKAALAVATTAALRGLTGKDYQTVEGWKKWKENAEAQANPFDS
jgi:HEAT repeat protein